MGLPTPAVQVTIQNNDTANSIYYGTSSSITIGGGNTGTLAPLTSITLDGSATWWAVAPDGTLPMQVLPGGQDPTASPEAVATALIETGVATLIAEAIAETGLPLIGNPVLLYTISALPPSVGAGLVGGSVPNNSFLTGCYNADIAGVGQQDIGDGRFITATGRSSAGGHFTATKKFWNPSEFNVTVMRNNMTNYAAYGTKVVVCLQPVITFGLAAGSDFTLVGTTTQKAAATADKTSLTAFLTTLQTMGFTAQTAQIVLHQEPGNTGKGISPTDYGNMWKTYGPTVNASIFPAVINVNYTGAIHRATDYANAALGLRGNPATGVTFGGIAMDWYTNSYLLGLMLTTQDANGDSIIGIADAQSLPFGLNEVGCKPAVGVTTCRQYMTDDSVNSVLAVMAGRLQAGKNNLDVIYFDGLCSGNGTGDISSPIGQDPSTPQPDFRAALFDEWFDQLTSVPSVPFTITANHTTTITPIKPSPVGGLSSSNYLSYEIALGLTAGVGSTNPWVSVTLLWFDFDQIPKNQTPIAKEVWHVPMGTNGDANGPLIVYGGGRMHGGYLQVKINNQDTVTCTVNFMQIAGTSRVGARSNWFWNPNTNVSPAVPGFTNADAADQSMQIGREYGQTVNAGATKTWLNGLFCGEAIFRCKVVNAAASDVTVELQPVPSGVFNAGTDILHFVLGAAGNFEVLPMKIALPRAPTILTVTNNDVNQVTIEYLLTAIETG